MKIIIYYILLLLGGAVIPSSNIDYGKIFNEAYKQINIPSEITEDIELPNCVYVEDNFITLDYIIYGDNITADGIITRSNEDNQVEILVKATYRDKVSYRYFDTIIKKQEIIEDITIYMDMEELYVNYLVEFTLDSKYNREDYTWESSDKDVIEIDEEYLGFCSKAGTSIISIYNSNGRCVGKLEVEVKNLLPRFQISDDKLKVGDIFSVKPTNYSSISLFDITISDENIISYDSQKQEFISKGTGSTEITFTLKDDKKTSITKTFTIYGLNPEINTNGLEVTIGASLRIDVLNYDLNEYDIEVDSEIAKIENNNLIPLNYGLVKVTVILKSNKEILSSIDVNCLPIMPVLVCANPVINVGDNTPIFITNLEELVSNNEGDYLIESLTPDICSIKDNTLQALKVGTGKFKVTLNNLSIVTSICEVTITKASDKKLANGEIGEGPLIVKLENNKDFYQIGEKVLIEVEGLIDPENYNFVSSNQSLVSTLDDGHLICKAEGISTIYVISNENKEIRGSVNVRIKGRADIDYIARLIEVAEGELGYEELPNTESKYGIWYGIPDGHWCAMFVTWCAHYAGIDTSVIPFYCSCSVGWEWFQNQGRAGFKGEYIPKAGDVIFFLSNGAGHTGIVTGCDGNIVYTIEGNTSDMVARRSYPLDYSTITGYGIPNYQ